MATIDTHIRHPQKPPPPPPKTKHHNGSQPTEHIHNGSHPNHTEHSKTPLDTEKVVMTPRGKTANSTIILIERKLIDSIGERQHVAGGDHTGIIINKDTANGHNDNKLPQSQLSLEFRVFLVSENTGQHSQEARTLRFWFRPWITNGGKQAHVAQDFFRELVSPKEFPRGIFRVSNFRAFFQMLRSTFT